MFFKRQNGIDVVVFGAHCQDNTLILEANYILLECDKCLTVDPISELDPCQSIFCNHTAPQGIIKVQNQTLPTQPKTSTDDRCGMSCEQGQGIESHGLLCHIPVSRVTPSLLTKEC